VKVFSGGLRPLSAASLLCFSADPLAKELAVPVPRSLAAWLCALLCPLLLLPRPARSQVQLPDPRAVDGLLRESMAAWHVPGAALAIVVGDRVVLLKGYGVKEAGGKAAVTPDTLFLLGSCSKPFTALLLAILADEGKLHWDDPVRRHLAYFRLADPLADENVTLRDLLSHRTGVDGHDLLWYHAPWGQEEMIRRAGKLRPNRGFRAAFQYQSILYSAAGQAGAAAAGASWQELIHRRVFGPLGMTRTTVTSAETARLQDRATPHRRTADGKTVTLPWYPFPEGNPAGSVCSCARDLATFLRLQLAEGTFGGKRLVSADNLLETRTPQVVIPVKGPVREMNPYTLQMGYGMGWVVQDYRGQLMHVHGGAIDGFRCQLTLLPEARLGIAIVSNMSETQMNLAVTNTLIDHLLGMPYKDWNAHYAAILRRVEEAGRAAEAERLAHRHKGTRPSRELSAYVGSYHDPAYGTCRVTLEAGKLYWHWSSFRSPLEHFHFDTFNAPHEHLVNVQVVFTLAADGEVNRLEALGRTFRKQ
jgi:CubicO group peptidase (beta-lactamase class C family)